MITKLVQTYCIYLGKNKKNLYRKYLNKHFFTSKVILIEYLHSRTNLCSMAAFIFLLRWNIFMK